jgi:hypothetical protein
MFITNNGTGLVKEVKRGDCGPEHHYLDASRSGRRAHNALQRIQFRRWRLILEGVTARDVSDSEID